MVNYFFDTYAVIEILNHNPAYKKYRNYPLITLVTNKIELHWWALLRHDQNFADILLKSLSNCQEITDDLIQEAMAIRLFHKKKKLSYADALGYAFAKKHKLKFLTGDKEFHKLPGVEFVK